MRSVGGSAMMMAGEIPTIGGKEGSAARIGIVTAIGIETANAVEAGNEIVKEEEGPESDQAGTEDEPGIWPVHQSHQQVGGKSSKISQ